MKQVLTFLNCLRFTTRLKEEKGQSVVEYLLVLIVTVSILLLFKDFFKGGRDFMDRYMGDYIACLMEYGELPTLKYTQGSGAYDLTQHKNASGKKCDSEFAGFTIGEGKPAIGGGGGSSSGPGSSKTNSSRTDANSSRSAASGSGSSKKGSGSGADSEGSSDSGGSSGSESGGRSASKRPSIQRRSLSGGSSGYGTADNGYDNAGNDRERILAGGGDKDGSRLSGRQGRNRIIYEQDSAYRAVTGSLKDENKTSIKSSRAPTASVISTANADTGGLTPRKGPLVQPPPKLDEGNDIKESSMSFGYFIKWLIIAAMGIAIFLFFGSQVMNFFNSQEK